MKAMKLAACCATLTVTVACLASGCGKQGPPPGAKQDDTANSRPKAEEAVDARKLLKDFARNEEEAFKLYGNKMLAVEGLVGDEGKASAGEPLILNLVEANRPNKCLGCTAECKCGCTSSLIASGNFTAQDVTDYLVDKGKVGELTRDEALLFEQLAATEYAAYIKERLPIQKIICQFEPGSAHYERHLICRRVRTSRSAAATARPSPVGIQGNQWLSLVFMSVR